MKSVIILLIATMLIPNFGITQVIENLEYISPFNNEVSAIKKEGQWAFINKKGAIVIPFRNDLVSTKINDGSYPVFNSNRCLIIKKENGISYFGYIDKMGKTVIEPKFLNATNFDNNVAIVLKLVKENIGRNDLLDKNVVYYRYFETTIDTAGNTKIYLSEKGTNVVLDKKFLKKPPQIMSKFISENLVSIITKDQNWNIKNINE